MDYTEFRKSYGDFEIVIPAIDFSMLNAYEAIDIVFALNEYNPYSRWAYVCNHLMQYGNHGNTATNCICDTIDQEGMGLEYFIQESMNDTEPMFHPIRAAGRVLRIEWCKHMAKEIEREFGL